MYLSVLYISTCSTDLAYSKGVIADWTHTKLRKIVWMNEPRHEDFACAGLAVSFLFPLFPHPRSFPFIYPSTAIYGPESSSTADIAPSYS